MSDTTTTGLGIPNNYYERMNSFDVKFCPNCGAEFEREKPKIIGVFVKAEGHWSDDGVYVTLPELKKLLKEIK